MLDAFSYLLIKQINYAQNYGASPTVKTKPEVYIFIATS